MSPSRLRLDERLVRDGLVESRSIAQRLVMAGSVRVDGQLSDKASRQVADHQRVEVEQPPRFVSRGGEKLENALESFAQRLEVLDLHVAGRRAIDVGASTGGFTDCLLQRGAAAVVAVDVGYGQLHQRLRNDPRVVAMDRTNARNLRPQDLPWQPDLLVCDTSFISLRTVLPGPIACMSPGFWGVLLCKPQFEAGRERLNSAGRGGVLRDEQVREQVLQETIEAVSDLGVRVEEVVQAHPPGPKGNVEYALLIRDEPVPAPS